MFKLPPEIEDYIIEEGGYHCPSYEDVKITLNYGEEELKWYLGTYWPRSFIEAREIFNDLLKNEVIKGIFQSKKELWILDIGSGTGGNLIGFLWFMKENFPDKEIYIIALDGNENALGYQKKFLNEFFGTNSDCQNILIKFNPHQFKNQLKDGLEKYEGYFDIAMSFKFISELICLVHRREGEYNHNFYKDIIEVVSKSLKEDGLFILLDVTYPFEESSLSKRFIPQIMTREIRDYMEETAVLKPIIPLSCAFWMEDDNCCAATYEGCFTQRVFKISPSPLKPEGDKSKVTYTVFAKKEKAKEVLEKIPMQEGYEIVQDEANKKMCYSGTISRDVKVGCPSAFFF